MLYGKSWETMDKGLSRVYLFVPEYHESWCLQCCIYLLYICQTVVWCQNAVLELHICVSFYILLGRVIFLHLGAYTLIFAVIAKQRKTMHASIFNQTQIRKAQLYLLFLSELQLVSILQHHLLLTAPGSLCYSTLLRAHSGFLCPFLLG